MTATAALLNQLTIDDYAREAFCVHPDGEDGFVQGGVYAGPLSNAPDARPWHASYNAPGDRRVSARARLVHVPPGKVFVRWARSQVLKEGGWKAAARGVWWVTDNIADRIVQETVRRFGRRGDSSIVARHFGNVGYTWTGGDDEPKGVVPGTYKSDMGAVVVCRTTAPIKVLVGVGRPVVNPTGPDLKDVTVDSRELQVVMLTTISSPKNSFDFRDPKNRYRFIGDQFLAMLYFGSSSGLCDYWLRAAIVDRRRTAQRIAARGR